MKIKRRVEDGVVVLEVSGKVMGGPGATTFHGKLHEFVTGGQKKIVINLAKVEWMSSVGLGMLISAMTTMKNADGELKLANVTQSIESLLTITRLITIFKAYDSVDEALAAFDE